MFRSQYDTDITTWSPDGKLYQVEYAMEAVKQGSCAVGVKNKKYVALGSLKRAPHELSSYQSKLFQISDYIGIAISGLAADGRGLSKYMRNECLNHQFVYSSEMDVEKLVDQVAKKSQKNTQTSGRRPFGVGMLVSGIHRGQPKVFETCPSGVVYDYKAIAIGARSQSARTYIERNVDQILESDDRNELILHTLRALKKTTTDNVTLEVKSTEVSIVGTDQKYIIFDSQTNSEELEKFLEIIENEENNMDTPKQQQQQKEEEEEEKKEKMDTKED